MEIDKRRFIVGFNMGYLLAEFENSTLTNVLYNLEAKNSFTSGLIAGKNEFDLSQTREQMNEISILRTQIRKEYSRDIDI